MTVDVRPREPVTGTAYVDLLWIPLGAGRTTGVVRTSGRAYEAIAAHHQQRQRSDLYHSALEVGIDGHKYVIEMTPVWGLPPGDRGVLVEGPVGLQALGRYRLFRYEVHCWRDGVIPDRDEVVGSPVRLSSTTESARAVLDLVDGFPPATWGRDELGTGEMWNSNSLAAWLLVRSGHDLEQVNMPSQGRAPGWSAGMNVAHRTEQRASRADRLIVGGVGRLQTSRQDGAKQGWASAD